jgi:phosphocarrier protein HPr
MSDVKVSRTLMVNNPQGIHARPANLIVRLAQQFQSRIEFAKENHRVDGKSILELLTLAAVKGTQLEVEATGPDAQQALDALAALFAENFSEGDEQPNPVGEPKHAED